ncbi:hypothetical protein DFH08DRAFT_876338 [Mycena albidolilacea]|uniref:Cupin type-2 domain-containing protein n=1 Tax=Mycena albidolilacea TaxID=1033008 RepID=A0AAD6ZTS4_9AGAR|nr:hypothetical protein DFH08DRAFT_876338 [Mycena albidolilacea]
MSDSLIADSWTLQDGISMTVLQNPLRTRVIVTGVGPKFYVPPHWHAAHDEIHVVLKGRLIVTQDGVRHVVGPEDGACITRRGVIHSLESFPGEELILEETTPAPEDTEQKIYFFRNLGVPGMLRSPLGIMQVFYHGDSYPKFPTGLRWLERPVIVALGGYIAPFLGYRLPDKRLRMDPSRFPRDKKD